MALLPALIAQGVTAADANAPRLPLTPYDQAIAALSARPAALKAAFWGGKRSGVTPIDRLLGSAWAAQVNPTVNAADAGFPVTLPDGTTYNAPSFDFTGNNNANIYAPFNFTGPSWSVAMVFLPPATGADGMLAFAYSGSGGAYGPFLSMAAAGGNIGVGAVYGQTAPLTMARTGRIIENGANIIVAGGDATLRQSFLFVNSKTPALSALGVGPAPWPTLNAGGQMYIGGGTNGLNASSDCRVAQGAIFDRSLYHDAAALPKVKALIQAAADTYGIPLV